MGTRVLSPHRFVFFFYVLCSAQSAHFHKRRKYVTTARFSLPPTTKRRYQKAIMFFLSKVPLSTFCPALFATVCDRFRTPKSGSGCGVSDFDFTLLYWRHHTFVRNNKRNYLLHYQSYFVSWVCFCMLLSRLHRQRHYPKQRNVGLFKLWMAASHQGILCIISG